MSRAAPLAVVDCPTGLAGNMLLAALFDLGLPAEVLHAPLAALELTGRYRLQLQERRSGGLRGLHLEVEPMESEPSHRHWRELRQRIAAAPLEPALREQVLAVFGLLAEAEASVHGHAPEEVHFHEVGAIDALVDVVGVCAGLRHFGVQQLVCGVPPAGHGSVQTAHGCLPLPAPAVLELARRRAVPLAASGDFPPAELTTPTGLALMAVLAERFGPAPALLPTGVGVGLGSRTLDRPNLLRLVLAEPIGWDLGGAAASEGDPAAPHCEPLLQQQAQLDDASAEDLAFLIEELRGAGAVEVFSQPVQMKKGRPGTLITVLAHPEQAQPLRQIWWRLGSSLGVRESLQQRWVLPREIVSLDTPWGPVRIKRSRRPDGTLLCKPEMDDLVELARRHALAPAALRRTVLELLEAQP
jgi:pyridinium-3,5-bisthiocarboxylic acid mononucleotide nickel chelatase